MALSTTKKKPLPAPQQSAANVAQQAFNAAPQGSKFDAFFAAADQAPAAVQPLQDAFNTGGFDAFFKAADQLQQNPTPEQQALQVALGGSQPPPQQQVGQPQPPAGASATPPGPVSGGGSGDVPPPPPPPPPSQPVAPAAPPQPTQPSQPAQVAVGANLGAGGTYGGYAPAATNQPLAAGASQATAQSAPVPTSFDRATNNAIDNAQANSGIGGGAYAASLPANLAALNQQQQAQSLSQQDLVQQLGQQAEQAGISAANNLSLPKFQQPTVNTALGTQAVAARTQSALQQALEARMLAALGQTGEDPQTAALRAQYEQQAARTEAQQREDLVRLGLLRSGDTAEVLGSLRGQQDLGRLQLNALGAQNQQAAIAQALAYQQAQDALNLQEGALVGNLRGTSTLDAQRGQADLQLALAQLDQQNRQFEGGYNLQRLGMQQDVADRTLNRLLTQTSPTQREIFGEGQRQAMTAEDLARKDLAGTQSIQQGQLANQTNLTAQQVAQMLQDRQFQAQFQPGNLALQGQQLQLGNRQITSADLANTMAGLQNTEQGTRNQYLGDQLQGQNALLGQQLQLGNRQITAADLANSQAGIQNQFLPQTLAAQLGLSQAQLETLQTQNRFLPQTLQQGLDLGSQQLTAADLANQAARTQNQFLPAMLQGNQTLQGQQIQLGNRQITAADLANTGMGTANDAAAQQLALARLLQPEQLRGATLQNDTAAQQLALAQLLQPGQVEALGLSNQGMRTQNQFLPLQLQQGLDLGGQQLDAASQANDITRLQRQFLPQELADTQTLRGQQVQLGNRAITGADIGNDLSAQQLALARLLQPEQVRGAGLQNDLAIADATGNYQGGRTLAGQQFDLGRDQVTQQNNLDRLAQLIAARSAGFDVGGVDISNELLGLLGFNSRTPAPKGNPPAGSTPPAGGQFTTSGNVQDLSPTDVQSRLASGEYIRYPVEYNEAGDVIRWAVTDKNGRRIGELRG